MSVIPTRAGPKAQAWIVAGLIATIIAIICLVGASFYLRQYTQNVCTSLNHGFSYVQGLNDDRIAGLRRSIKTDTKAGRTRKVSDSRKSLADAEHFRDAITPPHC